MPKTNSEKIPDTGEKSSKLDKSYRSMILVDAASTKYTIEWQHLFSIQQSAGIYIAALALIFSVFLTLVSGDSDTSSNVYSIFVNALFILVPICIGMLISVAMPKKVDDMPFTKDINIALLGKIDEDTQKLCNMFDRINMDILELNQIRIRRYKRTLRILTIAFIEAGLGLVTYFYDVRVPIEFVNPLNYSVLTATGMTVLYFILSGGTSHE